MVNDFFFDKENGWYKPYLTDESFIKKRDDGMNYV